MSNSNKIMTRVAQAAAVLFVALIIPLHPYTGSYVLKAIPTIFLAIIVFRSAKARPGVLLGIGLLFSTVGDVSLDIDRTRYFIVGLGGFLVAHIFYIVAMAHAFKSERAKIPGLLIVAAFGITIAYLLRGIPSDKLVPVMCYVAVITVMVLTAVSVSKTSKILIVGAALFMISDIILAINKFMVPIPYSTVFNIGIYFVAQFVIVKGFLSHPRLSK